MQWFKKSWKDRTYRGMTYALLFGSIVFQILILLVDVGRDAVTLGSFTTAVVPAFLFYIFLVLPLTYLTRNNP